MYRINFPEEIFKDHADLKLNNYTFQISQSLFLTKNVEQASSTTERWNDDINLN